jgi:hypothetical protein
MLELPVAGHIVGSIMVVSGILHWGPVTCQFPTHKPWQIIFVPPGKYILSGSAQTIFRKDEFLLIDVDAILIRTERNNLHSTPFVCRAAAWRHFGQRRGEG